MGLDLGVHRKHPRVALAVKGDREYSPRRPSNMARPWVDKEGQKRSTTEVNALTVQFLGGPRGQGGGESGSNAGESSGDPSPSAEDQRVTQRLVEAGEIVGIRVVDHVVVAEGGFYSFQENDKI